MFRQVLVVIDGVGDAARLMATGANAAERLDAGLVLIGVVDHERQRRAVEHRLHDLLVDHGGGCGAFLTLHRDGAVEAIIARVGRYPGSLLCLMSDDGAAGDVALMGRLTGELLRRAPSPALVVGTAVEAERTSAATWHRLVALVDSSACSERAVLDAAGFARSAGLELTLMQAPLPGDLFDPQRSHHYLEALAHSVRPSATAVTLERSDSAVDSLSARMNEWGDALVAVASRGRNASAQSGASWPLGSVAAGIVRTSRVPVLVFPQRRTPASNLN